MAKELYCSKCEQYKSEEEFTKFDRNPALASRNGRVMRCRDCCNEYVEERGNTIESLKEILQLVDLPFLENYGETALNAYKKKRQSTNIVTKKNVYDGKETQKIESNKLQTTIYTCYTSRIGLIPKKYKNFALSDGIREEEIIEDKEIKEISSDEKAIISATKFLVKIYGEEIFKDKEKFPKAVKLSFDEIGLHKNNSSKRQQKFKLKNSILLLIDNGKLCKEDFPFLYEEEIKNNEVEEIENTSVDEKAVEVDYEKLKVKWGSEYSNKDLLKFELKYNDLKRNYEIKTASHDEFLKLACIYSVRTNECVAKGDTEGAKTWNKMFTDTTNAGKLQPAQMSKADLTGGLSNFGEFWKTVEQAKDVVNILPEMYETPRDRADLVIYCLIQYVRRLKGLPDVEYKDIYKFYEEMESQFIDEEDEIDLSDFFDNQEGDSDD